MTTKNKTTTKSKTNGKLGPMEDVGGAWFRTSRNGNKFLFIKIKLKDEFGEVKVKRFRAFKNQNRTKDAQPDFRIFAGQDTDKDADNVQRAWDPVGSDETTETNVESENESSFE